MTIRFICPHCAKLLTARQDGTLRVHHYWELDLRKYGGLDQWIVCPGSRSSTAHLLADQPRDGGPGDT